MPVLILRLALLALLLLAGGPLRAEPSQPPLVPEGEQFEDIETLLANISLRAPVHSIAFSPDGAMLASGSGDNTVRLWEVTTGRELRRLKGHSNPVWSVAFSPDGMMLASGSGDNTVRLWEVATGRELRRLKGHSNPVWSVAFSPDGRLLASGSDDNTVRLWEVAAGLKLRRLEGHSNGVLSVTFSPDGRLLASGSWDNTARLWEVATGRELRHLAGHSFGARSVAFSPDGRLLASGSGDNTVRLWEVATGQELWRLAGHSNGVWSVAFSPDGRLLASGSRDNTVGLITGRKLRRLKGHSNSVLSVTFSPDGATLASGSADNTVRLWKKPESDGSDFAAERILVGGVRGTWLACHINGRCLRYDDGTLLLRPDGRGLLHPVWPPVPDPPASLRLISAPDSLTIMSGRVPPIVLKIRNDGGGLAYWVNVVDKSAFQSERLGFRSPPTQVILEPSKDVDLQGYVYAQSSYERPPSSGTFKLHLQITSAHNHPIPVQIPVTILAPALEWRGVEWLQKGDKATLAVSVANVGGQALSETKFSLRISNRDEPLSTVTQPEIKAGETANLAFALPADFELGDSLRVSLLARKLKWPIYRWQFDDKPVVLPTPPWPLYVALALLLMAIAAGLYYLRYYRHPLVTRLSEQPTALLELSPDQLEGARRLLARTHRLDAVLKASGVPAKWLTGAMTLCRDDPAARCQAISSRLAVECRGPAANDPCLWTLPLGQDFPLNLEQCLLYLPLPDAVPADVLIRLRNQPETADQVTLILSPDSEHQIELHRHASDPSNLWVAPTPAQLTGLMLAPSPVQTLAGLIAPQVPLNRISPYRTGGGTAKESVFFGRREIIAHVMNREPANYLVVGGWQLGKSSLLKALERRYRDHPQVRCFYLVLNDPNAVGRLARALNLPATTTLDGVLEYLDGTQERYLCLIDEADAFVRAERQHEYATLARLRALSEEGRCHFILAGFWDLYEQAVLDYQSPVRNFGETITIGALEPDACRDLAEKPMASMNIRYRTYVLVDELVRKTGQRANLISIACNEIIKNLDLTERMIEAEDLRGALDSDAIERALAGWGQLGSSDEESRLDRIIVYATVEAGEFSQAGLLRDLAERRYSVSPDRVERALRRLELAFVLGREQGRYFYRVPLQRELILAQEPQEMLKQELAVG